MKRKAEAQDTAESLPAPKRKLANGASIESRFHPGLLEKETLDRYTEAYANSQP